jgi:hypothetical protein
MFTFSPKSPKSPKPQPTTAKPLFLFHGRLYQVFKPKRVLYHEAQKAEPQIKKNFCATPRVKGIFTTVSSIELTK